MKPILAAAIAAVKTAPRARPTPLMTPRMWTVVSWVVVASGFSMLILLLSPAAAPTPPPIGSFLPAPPGWDLQSDGSYQIHRDAPATPATDHTASGITYHDRVAAPANPEPPNPLKVTLLNSFYFVEYGVAKGNFTLRNDNPFPVKDVPVTCNAVARSGTVLRVLTPTVYDVIPAHGSIKVQHLVLGIDPPQGYGVECAAGWAERA